MSKRQSLDKLLTVPIVIMLSFTIVLFCILFVRIYEADKDLAQNLISERQAVVAAESAVHFGLTRVRQALVGLDPQLKPDALVPQTFENVLQMGKWHRVSGTAKSWFRILAITRVKNPDDTSTPLLNENFRFEISAEGRCGRYLAKSTGLIQLTDLVRTFAVVDSLNEYYYGTPLQPWIERAGGLEALMALNPEPFKKMLLSPRGVVFDPYWLVKLYLPSEEEPFVLASGTQPIGNSYGCFYTCEGLSPCHGPLYCQTPIIVDTHKFYGPIQTAGWLFRRGAAKPVIDDGHSVVALTSSRRIQLAVDNLEGEMPAGLLVDRDSKANSSFLGVWKPNFEALRESAKRTGIYIDKDGKGFYRGQPIDIDYHPGESHLYSETYTDAVAVGMQQDEVCDGFIVLSSAAKYDEHNNIDSKALRGARLIFSERSVYIRGEIGGDLIIATPGRIFLTGSTNDEGPYNLFLIAGIGVALSISDLENYVIEREPSQAFIEAAAKWKIRAIIYKPGAGWYGSWSGEPSNGKRVWPVGTLRSGIFSITINGACIGGNLKRWVDHAMPAGVQIEWNPSAADRLPLQPLAANLLRMKSVKLN